MHQPWHRSEPKSEDRSREGEGRQGARRRSRRRRKQTGTAEEGIAVDERVIPNEKEKNLSPSQRGRLGQATSTYVNRLWSLFQPPQLQGRFSVPQGSAQPLSLTPHDHAFLLPDAQSACCSACRSMLRCPRLRFESSFRLLRLVAWRRPSRDKTCPPRPGPSSPRSKTIPLD